jgi:uncharacterized phage protein gp47/JayE|nr:baseplate J/gp47 family protein [Clostridium sp. OM04-12AA]DAV55827.1 MAG TPA: Baseplate J like protein [Caudoviricetes sp.]
MYEDMTYENILQGMLNRVPDDIDKREGSVIYDALAPAAYFLADQYFQLGNFVDLVLPDTALGEYLDRTVSAYGIARKTATAAVRKMITSGAVEIGTRWGISSLVYIVNKALTETEYAVICETNGAIGNQYSGEMQALSAVSGITATLGDIITAGTDEENDDAMRARFYEKVRLPATSGNAYHYQQWALEVPGVGAAKVIPLGDGPGTVTILVVDSDKAVSPTLPGKVAEYIETVRPIGATVSVLSPDVLEINIAANVQLDGSESLEEVKQVFKTELTDFLKNLTFSGKRVSYAKIGNVLLDVPGVSDFDTFTINGVIGNIAVGDRQVPVVGTISLTEVSLSGTD